MKSFILLFLISEILTFPIAAFSGSKVETPIAVVTDVIKHDDWTQDSKSEKMFARPTTTLMKKRFSRAFVRDWEQITERALKSPILDGDILTGNQNISEISFQSAQSKLETKEKSEVDGTFTYFSNDVEGRPKETKTMTFYLVKENEEWKVDDYEFEDWVGQPATEKTPSTLKLVKSTFRKVHGAQ